MDKPKNNSIQNKIAKNHEDLNDNLVKYVFINKSSLP